MQVEARENIGLFCLYSILAVSFIVISSFCKPSIAFADDEGIVKINVIHLNGDQVASPSEFVSAENSTQGYFSIYNNDSEFILDSQSCNFSKLCAVDLPVGSYEAKIASSYGSTTYAVPFEVNANQTTKASIIVRQGSYEVIIIDNGNKTVDYHGFKNPRDSGDAGWFALYDVRGNFLMDAETCNLSASCIYPFKAGAYVAAIRNAHNNQVLACKFDIADSSLSPVAFNLESGDCNQTPTDPPSGTDISPNKSLQRWTVSVLSNSHYLDQDGIYHLVGEVQNTAGIPAQDVVVTAVFYSNSTKEVLGTKRGHSIMESLGPGEKSPFEIVVKDEGAAPNIGNYTLTAVFSNTTSISKPSYLGINLTRNYYSNDTGLYHVEGRIFNYGDSIAHFVKVAASFYDQNHTLIYIAQKFVASQLPSSSPSDFQLDFSPINATKIASVLTTVQSQEYSMVHTTNGMLASPIILTLDSAAYDNLDLIGVNGTVGQTVPWEKYAIVYILWPDGLRYDKDLVRVLDDGSYHEDIRFYSIDELRGETFTVRLIYINNFSEKTFLYTS